jgi:adenylate cyclase
VTGPESASRSRLLTPDELAREAGAALGDVDALVAAGVIRPGADGLHEADDVRRVRLALALAEGGIDTDSLVWAMTSGHLPLDQFARTWPAPGPTSQTFGELVASLGARGRLLADVYPAFGLAVPSPESVIARDEEALMRDFLEMWGLVDDRPEVVIRAAHIAGDGVRRIGEATLDLFDEFEGSPPQRLRRGLSVEDAGRPSIELSRVLAQLVPWLLARHTEDEVFRRIIAYIEATATRAGRLAPRQGAEPAIAFVDLAGYTQLTQTEGDERAATFATTLQQLATTVVRAHRGRVVKLLGDGVMLRFGSAGDGVRAVLALAASVRSGGLPQAHAGLASGPVIVRDADVYGHTVNLAARIAAWAAPGDLLVPADLAPTLAAGGITVVDLGAVALKGISEPVGLARVVDPG